MMPGYLWDARDPLDERTEKPWTTERLDFYDLLCEIETYLDDRADVEDGDYGAPRPNRAMSLHQRLQEAIDRLKPEEQP